MTLRLAPAMGADAAACRRPSSKALTLAHSAASLWTEFCCAWMRWLARKRLQRSIAHLDDRLLSDIGLCPRDLGFAQRLLRSHMAASHVWTLKNGPSSMLRD
jgi:uncharacterized protein YjiS (DUF1127 family)